MKDNIELVKALLDGEILESEWENTKMFMQVTPRGLTGMFFTEGPNGKPFRIDPFTVDPDEWAIRTKKKKITDQYKLMAKVNEMMRSGKCFYVSMRNSPYYWRLPGSFEYAHDPTTYVWTYYDEHTGQPIGEPQDFLEEDNGK